MFPCQGQHPLHRGVSDPALLGPVERYFVEIMSIARLQQRIQCCIVTRTFEENAHLVSALTTAAGKSVLFPYGLGSTLPSPLSSSQPSTMLYCNTAPYSRFCGKP